MIHIIAWTTQLLLTKFISNALQTPIDFPALPSRRQPNLFPAGPSLTVRQPRFRTQTPSSTPYPRDFGTKRREVMKRQINRVEPHAINSHRKLREDQSLACEKSPAMAMDAVTGNRKPASSSAGNSSQHPGTLTMK
jgi:hypothetical protein